MNNKSIKDKFLDLESHYFKVSGDRYSASQMAATVVRAEDNLSKEELVNILKDK